MPEPDKTKKIKKKASDPFEAAGYEVVQMRFKIESIIKSFSDADRKNPNYKYLLNTIRTEVEQALNHKAREEHKPTGWWGKIIEITTYIVKNPVFLAIICIILGALLGNIELLKTILNFIKG